MGSCCSSDKIEPQELNKLRFSRTDSEDSDVFKNASKNRRTTDVIFLLLLLAFLIVLMGLLTYCIMYGDIYRVLNGYDNCGNVCGRLNYREYERGDDYKCKGLDMKTKTYLLLRNAAGRSIQENSINRECVENCDAEAGYRTFLNRCIPEKSEEVVNTVFSKMGLKNFFQEASEDVHLCWTELIYLCLIALGFSIIIMLLFRFFVGIVVWIVLIGVSLTSLAGTIYLWIIYAETKKKTENMVENMISDVDTRNSGSYLAFAIVATVITVCVILVILVLRKRIQLVVQLFKEAGKAISSMPMLLLEPLLTFISLALVISFWLYFCLWIQSSGFLTFIKTDYLHYKKDTVMKVTRWYNLLAMLWMAQFVIGCQHMVIAGAVATWYFARNKSNLGSPVLYAAYNLTRYHLGSVALGSFLIALVQLIRIILSAIQTYLKGREGKCIEYLLRCCQCCLMCFEKILKYLSRNAYIEVAMYGHSFCKGGKQAFKLLVANALRVTVINSVGDFVLFLGKVLVVMATVLCGLELLKNKEGIQHMWIPLGLAGVFAYFVSHCFLTVYEMAIDTIFLCFCEDCEQNDGVTKPYFMSRGLMDFVENSKKALARLDRSGQKEAWNHGPNTISATVDK